MKNFQQNLFVAIAIGLCSLCAYQWYAQTQQRLLMEGANKLLNEKSVAIRDYTNTIATMDHQISQLDDSVTGLKGTVTTNEQQIAAQRAEINQLEADGEALTNRIAEYKEGIDSLEAKLKEAYAGIEKQNQSLKDLVAQRDDFVQKYNDSVKERNDVVAKYNALVDQVNKAQAAGKQ
jgi:chromosome segregation ATPase